MHSQLGSPCFFDLAVKWYQRVITGQASLVSLYDKRANQSVFTCWYHFVLPEWRRPMQGRGEGVKDSSSRLNTMGQRTNYHLMIITFVLSYLCQTAHDMFFFSIHKLHGRTQMHMISKRGIHHKPQYMTSIRKEEMNAINVINYVVSKT